LRSFDTNGQNLCFYMKSKLPARSAGKPSRYWLIPLNPRLIPKIVLSAADPF
jgi:hypothetical protein